MTDRLPSVIDRYATEERNLAGGTRSHEQSTTRRAKHSRQQNANNATNKRLHLVMA